MLTLIADSAHWFGIDRLRARVLVDIDSEASVSADIDS